MSEHELWNELGNLYFLSGSYDRAVLAYNKAIQLESGFGKPYSNLALVYAKQSKYEDAIRLYKRSLELLTNKMEQAITWNRLGNAYRQRKEYQEAVFAYQCADYLKSAIAECYAQPDPILYVSSESETLPYDVVEEPLDYQSHSVDYLHELEPEYDEELPELVPVDAEVLMKENFAAPSTKLPTEGSERPVHVLSENGPTAFQENVVAELSPQLNEMGTENGEEDQVSQKEILVEEATQVENNVGAVLEEVTNTLEADVHPGGETPETNSLFVEPIAQAEDDVETLSEEITPTIPEAGIRSKGDAVGRVLTFTKPAAHIQDEPEEEFDSDPVSSTVPLVTDAGEGAQEAKREIGKEEEEKLTKQIEINPRSATTWESLGTLYKTAGRYKEAIQAFKQAISIAPRNVSCYHNLGLVYAAQGSNEEAFNTFQKVLELDPNHSLTHASLGGYYKKLGLDELAQKHIGKAMKHIYESENEYNRACLNAICGNVDQAIELLQAALENKQTYVEWVLNDPDLDALREDERFKQLISEYSK